jgi:hypothetical protein
METYAELLQPHYNVSVAVPNQMSTWIKGCQENGQGPFPWFGSWQRIHRSHLHVSAALRGQPPALI